MQKYHEMKRKNVIHAIGWILGILSVVTSLHGQTSFRWRDISLDLGITSPDRLPPSGLYPLTDNFTGHAVPFDYDQDGDLDILLTFGPHAADSLYSGLNRLYRNDGSTWTDVTAIMGLARFPPAGNAAAGDINGDGFLDLYLCLFGYDRLLINENGQRWLDVTDSAGVKNDDWSTDAIFFDANQDGYLDLYIANYIDYPHGTDPICIDSRTRQRITCDPMMFDPAPNRLFINDGTGRFHDATATMGMLDTTSRSLAVELLDANSDNRLDLFVLSHRSPNLLYINTPGAGMIEMGLFSGVALAPNGSEPEWSQVSVSDIDQNGHIDLLLTSADSEILVMLNNGRGQFFEGQYQTGLFQPRFPYRATNTAVIDLDFNGTNDLIIADTRHEHLQEDMVADDAMIDSLINYADSAQVHPDSTIQSQAGFSNLNQSIIPNQNEISTQDYLPNSLNQGNLSIAEIAIQSPAGPEFEESQQTTVDLSKNPSRILIHHDRQKYRSVNTEVPMILDTLLLVPKVSPLITEDSTLDFLDMNTQRLSLFPSSLILDNNESARIDLLGESTTTDTTFGSSAFQVDTTLSAQLSGMPDTVIVDTSAISISDAIPTETSPVPEIPRYVNFDTLVVYQEAERYVIADLTGDGIEEIIATYSARIFSIWQRELNNPPHFIGLWPRSFRAGNTTIGAEIIVAGDGFSRKQLITDNLPVVFYFAQKPQRIEISVRWPDGFEGHYSTTLVNRTYTITRL